MKKRKHKQQATDNNPDAIIGELIVSNRIQHIRDITRGVVGFENIVQSIFKEISWEIQVQITSRYSGRNSSPGLIRSDIEKRVHYIEIDECVPGHIEGTSLLHELIHAFFAEKHGSVFIPPMKLNESVQSNRVGHDILDAIVNYANDWYCEYEAFKRGDRDIVNAVIFFKKNRMKVLKKLEVSEFLGKYLSHIEFACINAFGKYYDGEYLFEHNNLLHLTDMFLSYDPKEPSVKHLLALINDILGFFSSCRCIIADNQAGTIQIE